MDENSESNSELMARLTLSAIGRLTQNSCCWREPIVHKALLLSGLSVMLSAMKILDRDLNGMDIC